MRREASVMHLDLDAFFASVEQRDKPSLRGKPVVVGGIGHRGVVATASYEARVFGVRSAMRTVEARARCPHAAFLSGRFEAYRESSKLVMGRLREVSPLVEPLSFDEAFVDLAAGDQQRDLSVAGVTALAQQVRADIAEMTGGLTASVGIASSKLMAKIASELDKPDGLFVVAPGSELEVLSPMQVTAIPGVGPATAERLRRIGVLTVEAMQQVELDDLVRVVGSAHGQSLHQLCRAIDRREVVAERETKSVSVEDTFETDITDPAVLAAIVGTMSSRVAARLTGAGLSGRTVTLKIRHHDFETHTRSSTLAGPTDDRRVLARTARGLLAEIDTSAGIRLIGVGVSGLADWVQDDLFTDLEDLDAGVGTQDSEPTPELAAEARPRVPDPTEAPSGRSPARTWSPGMDVEHAEHGPGWVWGSGLGRVTVRFETRRTPPGPVRTFSSDDAALRPRSVLRDPPDTVEPMSPSDQAPPNPPVAAIRPVVRSHHGDDFVDDYEWLRDKEDPETIAYLTAENAYADAQTSHLAPLRETIFGEIKARTMETDLSVPSRRGDWWYYSRTVEGKEYALHCRCPIDDADDWTPPELDPGAQVPGEQVLLDGNVEAAGAKFFSLGAFSITVDGNLLAFAVDKSGDERFTLRVKDLDTGDLLPDVIDNVYYGATWSLEGTHLFYTTVDEAWRPDRVWRHALGTSAADDVVVHHETDERFFTGIGTTRSDRYLMIASGSKITTEVRVLPAEDPQGEFRVVAERRTGIEYSVDHAVIGGVDAFLVLHNDGAENFALATAPVDDPGPHNWQTIIEHRHDTRLDDVDAFAGQIVVSLRRDALARLRVIPVTDTGLGDPHEIAFSEELFTSALGGNPEWDQPVLRLGYGSFVTPSTVYDYVVATGELLQRKQQIVLGDFDPAAYEQHRAWATADDGTRVPISIVCAKDTPRDGSAPALLYGYGSYEHSIDPGFSVSRLSLLDRGMVFAVAHVRGGGEMGRAWYENGKTLTKRNTFTDFSACARHLAQEGWTSANRLVAEGGSAGGLLMGVVANTAPEAFAGIVANVPFVDALTSILDPSLPLTVIEWDEWGDPLHDHEVYAYMKSYTPYENVSTQQYPPVLAITSLNDTRVLYVEPAKWVARLRATAAGDAQVLLKTEMEAGHGGVSGRYAGWKERAYELAWILATSGALGDASAPPAGAAVPR
ncbi:MAG: DNA polymerase IV [Nocardioidaceae bacterium]|nr:DNA polymerase IV [Nocardioidaceae bacterium]